MKQKKITRKISIRKETISNLNNDQMNSLHGGEKLTGLCTTPSPWGQTCDDCPTMTYCTVCINCA
ncbi:MAG TPA: class I lanthipeptide [Candidatus Kapabacteria bacterium]|nr:class I lanthipeptide [Candidatus Kapabacteria bacterium]